MKFKVEGCYGIGIVLETDDVDEAIKYVQDKEGSDYESHLEYRQHCAEDYERPADYYPTYYIIFNNKNYSIEDISSLRTNVKTFSIYEEDIADLKAMKEQFIKEKKSENTIDSITREIEDIEKKMKAV